MWWRFLLPTYQQAPEGAGAAAGGGGAAAAGGDSGAAAAGGGAGAAAGGGDGGGASAATGAGAGQAGGTLLSAAVAAKDGQAGAGEGAAAAAAGQAGGQGAASAAGQAAAGAEWAPKLPDGVQMDEAQLGAFKGLVKESGLKGEHAQKLFDLGLTLQRQAVDAVQQQLQQQQQTERAARVTATKADPEVGGVHLEKSLQRAGRALREYAGSADNLQALVASLDKSGLGDDPAVLRFLARVGADLEEDSSRRAGEGDRGRASATDDVHAFARDMYRQSYEEMTGRKR